MDPAHSAETVNPLGPVVGEQPKDAGATDCNLPQAVRFASVNEEIEPARSLQSDSQSSKNATTQLSPQAEEEIRQLSLSLHKSRIQQQRMSHYAFEPVSVPVSRAHSNDSSPYLTSREPTRSGYDSPITMPTPPLTPSGTHLRESQAQQPDTSGTSPAKVHPDPRQMAPQMEGLKAPAVSSSEGVSANTAISRPDSLSGGSTPPTLNFSERAVPDASPTAEPVAIGQSHNTLSQGRSRDESPFHESGSGTVTPGGSINYPRPFTPAGDRDDPYARSKRAPQSRNLDAIEGRFKFGNNDSRRRSGMGFGAGGGFSGTLPRSSSGTDLKNEHRQSTFSLPGLGGGKKEQQADDKHHGSMSELKRFFFGGHNKSKRTQSPSSSSARGKAGSVAGSETKTPPYQAAAANIPFADDHGLVTKYGKFGKMLGSGAGGSVRLMKRAADGKTFAVKQFRERHSYESEREYNKKVTAEFCIGSTLHHGNIIETLDIIHESGKWYEVMEYAPYDLFAIVMTGKMVKEEITCCFLQIVAGVAFLHSVGLAHRDLKLDNVVVNKDGIMKLIDFGSASVFRYPFETDIILSSGVVGSDPYLAPEVYDKTKYDPQPTDIWSLAIIFACMSLRRFPWKAPRMTDNSYKLFASPPSPGTPGGPELPKERSKSATDSEIPVTDEQRGSEAGHVHQHHHHHHDGDSSTNGDKSTSGRNDSGSRIDAPKQEAIRGPWRLLRLLPRETRTIIGRMLEINPQNRATLDEVTADPWVKDSPVCQQVEGERVIRAGTHSHTLEPGSSEPSAKQ